MGIAGAVTAVLTLDTTVVLLTPVVVATALRMHIDSRPHSLACVRVANAGSLLLPVSNLTNLLAFGVAGLSFGHFAALLAFPWLAVLVAEWAVLRLAFRDQLKETGIPKHDVPDAPRFALAILALTVTGFIVLSALDISPAWMAAASCTLLGTRRLIRCQTTVRRIAIEANPGFLVFVLALGVVVAGVSRHGGGQLLSRITPHGQSLGALIMIALLAAVVANLVNNIPATLALLPIVAGVPLAVLAVLIGVNIGPNLTMGG